MSVWLKVSLILFATVVANVALGLTPVESSGLTLRPSVPHDAEQLFEQRAKLMDALLVRPPQTAIRAYGFPSTPNLAHGDLVRLAVCLRRKRLVSAATVAAIERDRSLGKADGNMISLEAGISRPAWWFWLTWGIGLALIALVVFRHVRRRPPGAMPASS